MAERVAASRLAPPPSATAKLDSGQRARLGPRILSFAVDSLVLFAFGLVVWTAAMLNVFFRTDSGRSTLSHGTAWTSVAIAVACAPLWLVFNLFLSARRGQTVGQYVAGLHIQREDGRPPTLGRLLLYWLALHPVLFHPFLAASWGLVAYLAISFSGSGVLLIGALVVTVLSVIAPLIAFIAMATDHGRRGLHDRVAGFVVTRLE